MFVYILHGCFPPSLLALGWSCLSTHYTFDRAQDVLVLLEGLGYAGRLWFWFLADYPVGSVAAVWLHNR